MRTTVFLTVIAVLLLGAPAALALAPNLINYQGILTDPGTGDPIIGSTPAVISIYYGGTDVGGGFLVYTENVTLTTDAGGRFNHLIGSQATYADSNHTLTASDFITSDVMWIELTVGGTPLLPRVRLVSVAYAQCVATVDSASGGAITSKVSIGPGHSNTGDNAFVAGESSTASGLSSTVSGGAWNAASGIRAVVGGGQSDTASGDWSVVGGGYVNTALGFTSTVAGGSIDTASGLGAVVSGGGNNTASGAFATIAGGGSNRASGDRSTIGGGESNIASGADATVPGGVSNEASGTRSLAAGSQAKANHNGTFVWADNTGADFASTGDNQYLIRASGGVGVNTGAPTQTLDVNGQVRIRGGNPGFGKVLTSSNDGTGTWETPPSSTDDDWTMTGDVVYTDGEWGIARAGNTLHGTHDSTHVNLGVASVTGDGASSSKYATVGGGCQNVAGASNATVSGGNLNWAGDVAATVGGGYQNAASGNGATTGGGFDNDASGGHATIAGGSENTASGSYTTVGGGQTNTVSGSNSTISGGDDNVVSGSYSTIPGGHSNSAAGDYSLAAGYRAHADHSGCFVWADANPADLTTTGIDQFLVRAAGGITIYTSADLSTGVRVAGGSSGWLTVSDRDAKRNIRPVDGNGLLEKLAQLEISRWSYKSQDESIEHIGPMAQDFYQLFGVGENDKTISTIDPDGIALAAIQELHRRMGEIDELRAEVDELKALVRQLTAQAK